MNARNAARIRQGIEVGKAYLAMDGSALVAMIFMDRDPLMKRAFLRTIGEVRW